VKLAQPQNRTKTGQFQKGKSGNPGGRPKKGIAIIDKFRDNPDAPKVIEKIFSIAKSLGTKEEHKEAMSCAKIIADKLIPTLKAQEVKMETGNDVGFVFMPNQKESEKE
tara:strand:- start:132 stop:458 length:327 start_codon:yes stop_codon:yes gene_type:complete